MTRIILALFVLFPGIAWADHFGDFYVVPVAAHTPGARGSMWQTDLVMHNFQSTPVTIEIALVDSGSGVTENFFPVMVDGAETVTLAPGATRVVRDLLRDHRGRASSIGALLVGGDGPFALTSRVFDAGSAQTGIGEVVPAAHDFLESSDQRAIIPGLTVSADFRSNLGFVAAADASPLVVEVSLANAAGTNLGAKTFTIPAGAISHLQLSSTELTNAPFDIGTATVRIVSGSGNVSGYGSVVDNRSNHVTFVSGGFAAAAAAQQTTFARRLETLR